MDTNKHRNYLSLILKDIVNDELLCQVLKFKGGTAAMMFYGLPRFSTDLDFNLTAPKDVEEVYRRLQKIVLKYGKIKDANIKRFGPIIVLDYGRNECNLKIEVSVRRYDNHYQAKDWLGKKIDVMTESDMFSNKLCAAVEREAPRDIFDIWFFATKMTPINSHIIYERTGLDVSVLLNKCVERISGISSTSLMAAMGEVLDSKQKDFVRHKLIDDVVFRLRLMAENPVIAEQELTEHAELLERDKSLIPELLSRNIDPSMTSNVQLEELYTENGVMLRDARGLEYQCSVKDGNLLFSSGASLEKLISGAYYKKLNSGTSVAPALLSRIENNDADLRKESSETQRMASAILDISKNPENIGKYFKYECECFQKEKREQYEKCLNEPELHRSPDTDRCLWPKVPYKITRLEFQDPPYAGERYLCETRGWDIYKSTYCKISHISIADNEGAVKEFSGEAILPENKILIPFEDFVAKYHIETGYVEWKQKIKEDNSKSASIKRKPAAKRDKGPSLR